MQKYNNICKYAHNKQMTSCVNVQLNICAKLNCADENKKTAGGGGCGTMCILHKNANFFWRFFGLTWRVFGVIIKL